MPPEANNVPQSEIPAETVPVTPESETSAPVGAATIVEEAQAEQFPAHDENNTNQ